MGAKEVITFLKYLVIQSNVAVSTQRQALNALVFLYSQVLNQPLGALGEFQRVKRPTKLPVVLTRTEIKRLFEVLDENQVHLEKVKKLHEVDLQRGCGEVYLPNALARKYPNAGMPDHSKGMEVEICVPSSKLSVDPRTEKIRSEFPVSKGGLKKNQLTTLTYWKLTFFPICRFEYLAKQ